jgi:hypothetical protein
MQEFDLDAFLLNLEMEEEKKNEHQNFYYIPPCEKEIFKETYGEH